MSEKDLIKGYERYVSMCDKYGFQPVSFTLYQLGAQARAAQQVGA